MRRVIFLIRLAIITGGLLAGFRTLHLEAAIHDNLPEPSQSQAVHRNADPDPDRAHGPGAFGPSCIDPTPDAVRECQKLEQQILASTVRIEWNLWVKDGDGNGYSPVYRIAHGTVMHGRYLVTHNHSRALLSEAKKKEFNRVSLYTSDGKLIWPKGPLNDIRIIVEDQETLVLDFGDYNGQGLFAMLGIPSARFSAGESLPLQPGMEVAQIDWDRTKARVDWVMIEEVITGDGTPRLELANVITPGASGGGVFWNGYHIANTWYDATVQDEIDGGVSRQFSVAALNSAQVAAQPQQRDATLNSFLIFTPATADPATGSPAPPPPG